MENDIEPASNLSVVGPISEERYHRLYSYLSADGRYQIIQIVLGHPEHLVSRPEFDYYLSDFEGAIEDILAELTDKDILTNSLLHGFEISSDLSNSTH